MNDFLPVKTYEKFLNVYEHLPPSLKAGQEESPFASSLEDFLSASGNSLELQAGEILFLQDDIAESMFWIEDGVLAILQGELDSPRLLGFRFHGQVIGEIALLENIPRTASVAAIRPSRLKYISKEKFQAFIKLIPDMGVEIMRLLSARLREVQPAEYGDGLYDPLTHALSRQVFDSRIQEEIKRARLYRYSFLLAFVDLDKFKQINDTYGHARGDDVLVTFTQRMIAELRTTDLLFRYGGDEFVLILPRTRPAEGVALCDRVRRRIEERLRGRGGEMISCSFGVAGFPGDGCDFESLIRAADCALYRAKHGGRNAVVSVAETTAGLREAA
jgi:diguanylate cyclase (GGDEF)-like protein